MKSIFLILLGQLLLGLIVTELGGWMPAVTDAILRLAARLYPEAHRPAQLSEWRDHLDTIESEKRPLSRLIWALVILASAVVAGWNRHGRPDLGTYLATYRTETSLRAALREWHDVERLRHDRIGRVVLIARRAAKLLTLWTLSLILFVESLLLGGMQPDQAWAVNVATAVLVYAFYLGSVRGVVAFTRLLDAGIAVAMASIYSRYRPRAERRIARLEQQLRDLSHRRP